MVSGTIAFVYSYTLLELALDMGAVYFAYRLTRITGAFRGWILMILALVLITVQSTSSILTLALFFPEAQLVSLIASIGTTALIRGAVIGIAVSAALFGSMVELFATFKRLGQRQTDTPKQGQEIVHQEPILG